MTEHDTQQPTVIAPAQPLPAEVTEHPAWRLIWQKLLAPTPDEIDAAKRDDETERVA